MAFEKQVDVAHYTFGGYYSKERWASLWYQVDEVIKFKPESVLEVGGGLGVFKRVLECMKIQVTISDIADDLKPDILGDVTALPVEDSAFDVACAFQVLEHIPFEDFTLALSELKRVSRLGVVISIPNWKPIYSNQIMLPGKGKAQLWLPRPFAKEMPINEQGEHKWELNRKGFELDRILQSFADVGLILRNHYRVPENPYHHFFILQR